MASFLRMVVAAILVFCGVEVALAADDDTRVALKLFGAQDIENGLGTCRFSLWQDDRDPVTDRYAYLFHVNSGDRNYAGPARLKVGDTVHQLYELASGGRAADGVGSDYLFASNDREIRVHIELLAGDPAGDSYRIKDARMTVIQKGKVPFVAVAKGMRGCVRAETASAAPSSQSDRPAPGLPNGIPIGRQTLLDDMSQLPPVLLQLVRDQAGDDCDVDGFHAWGGARYVINENYLLWEVPCFSGAYQAATVLAVTQNPPQGWGNLLTLPNPPGVGGEEFQAMNADILGPKGLIRTTALNRGIGDCGTYQVHRLIDGPGEVLELDLLEYREKSKCDGIEMLPSDWPLVYRSY
ncbi:DUF1176 domain-containing protein [Roseibium sediminicola]|uniref:DUF1176 domain-containing protein n=1 Tax=Roseibium sediminicola TaxID=2933272 RepID=A0ABT0GWY1_9HYPH|nr:DUF1176 domain-containing protein [Roseibium sp. CAU 1639]MCK7613956.1 DUF1176 domain-containing protein [Roseibium sp. CAU 1639]